MRACGHDGHWAGQVVRRGLIRAPVRLALVVTVILALGLGLVGSAGAVLVKGLEFNVLPSAEPNVSLLNSTGFPEAALYSVSGGVLEQRTTVANLGNASYMFPINMVFGASAGLSSALSTVIEARLKVLTLNVGPPELHAGVFFQAFDGAQRYGIFFDNTTGIRIPNAAGGFDFVSVTHSQWNTYRVESPGGSNELRLFVNGVLVHVGAAQAHFLNGFNFGDGVSSANNNGDADWDYIRLFQDEPLTSPFPGLVDKIEALGLRHGLENALRAKANAAARHVADGDIDEALGSLQALLNQVSAQEGKKLTTPEADELRDCVALAIQVLPAP